STAWYRDVLGLTHLYSFGELAFFDMGGVRLYLQQTAEPVAESLLYFRVDDMAAAHAALSGQGVHFVTEPHMVHRHADGTEEWMAFCNDPEGRPLALMAQTRTCRVQKLSPLTGCQLLRTKNGTRTRDDTCEHTGR